MATGKDQEAPSLLSLRQQARTIYGRDAQGYDTGRPDYPAEVYEILAARCGLRAGASVVEIGPGTGLVTRRLWRPALGWSPSSRTRTWPRTWPRR